jgi:hypothetical protein
MKRIMSALEVLTNPDGFFDRASDDPSLLGPALVVTVVAVVSAAASLPAVRAVQQAFTGDASAAGSFALVGGVVGGFGAVFVFWVLYTVVFHVIAAVAFDGSGSLGRLLSYVGWGHLPAILSAATGAVVNAVVFRSVTPPSSPQEIQAFIQGVRSQPEFLVAGVVGLAVLTWQAFIWVFAVQHSHDIDRRSAAIAVAVPVGLQALWQLWNLL